MPVYDVLGGGINPVSNSSQMSIFKKFMCSPNDVSPCVFEEETKLSTPVTLIGSDEFSLKV